MEKNEAQTNPRRKFFGSLAAGAAAVGMLSIASPLRVNAEMVTAMENDYSNPMGDADLWFNKVKGKHRIVYDVTKPNGMMPFAWPRVFLITNAGTGSPASDCGVVDVFRHEGIPFAFEDRIWEKYKFGEVFKIDDDKTKAPAIRNAFAKPQKGDFKVPGLGEVAIGINELQADGVMFCVCNMAMTVYSAVVADNMKMDAAEVKKDWMSGLLPGIQVVPSGVWAVGRAQEHGCKYCFAG